MKTSKVTSKGQITVPKDIRESLGIRAGDELEFIEDEQGIVTVRKHREPGSFYKWMGYSKQFEGQSTDDVMEELRGRRPNDPIE